MASLESSLQCPICLELLNDPKQLSCTHTFCTKCLIDLCACSSLSDINVLTCPICQITKAAVGGGVANLKTNVPLKCLVEDFRNSKEYCEMCDKKARAKNHCCECGMTMCKACLKIHNKWSPNLKHEVVRVEDIREGKVVLKQKVYCQEHKSAGQEYICTDVCVTCKKFICLRCRILYHEKKGHTVQDAEEYNRSINREIVYLLDQGKTKAATIKHHITFVESQMNRVIDHIDGKQAEINKVYDELSKQLREKKATLDWQLCVQKKELLQRLEEMIDENNRLVLNIESTSVLAGYSLKAPLGGDTVAIHDSLSGELKNLLDRNEEKLAADVAEHAEGLTFIPSGQGDELDIGEIRFEKFKLKCDVDLSRKNSMNVMAASPDGKMAIGCHSGGIEIFSEDGQQHQTVLNDVHIRGLGLLTCGQYVVRHTNNNISLYTSGYEKMDVRFETLSHDEGGKGELTVDSEDQIYVSYMKAKKIQVFSPTGGKAIREIPCHGYEPWQITSYDDVLIVKQCDNAIVIIDKEGDIKHKLSKPSCNTLYAAATKGHSVLIASVRHEEGLVSIDEYTNELMHVKALISDYKFGKTEREWYYLQQFQSGEIAFSTPDRLYIFTLFIDKCRAWLVHVNSDV